MSGSALVLAPGLEAAIAVANSVRCLSTRDGNQVDRARVLEVRTSPLQGRVACEPNIFMRPRGSADHKRKLPSPSTLWIDVSTMRDTKAAPPIAELKARLA